MRNDIEKKKAVLEAIEIYVSEEPRTWGQIKSHIQQFNVNDMTLSRYLNDLFEKGTIRKIDRNMQGNKKPLYKFVSEKARLTDMKEIAEKNIQSIEELKGYKLLRRNLNEKAIKKFLLANKDKLPTTSKIWIRDIKPDNSFTYREFAAFMALFEPAFYTLPSPNMNVKILLDIDIDHCLRRRKEQLKNIKSSKNKNHFIEIHKSIK